jgi:hypothetical protein
MEENQITEGEMEEVKKKVDEETNSDGKRGRKKET